MSQTPYERPTLTDLGTVEELTQGTISYKTNSAGLDVTYNKKKVKSDPTSQHAGNKYIS